MMPFLVAKLSFWLAAAGTGACRDNPFLFLPHWWEYLPQSELTTDSAGACVVSFQFPHDILLVGLAVLDMLLRIAGFVAVISIIVSGFQHQFTMGSPEKAAAARSRLYNSLIGLAIALVATAIVTFIGNQLAS